MMSYGMDISVAPVRPRYTLPAEVLPGVPWPPGFKQETDEWAAKYCGTDCVVERDGMLVMGSRMILHPDTYLRLRRELEPPLRF